MTITRQSVLGSSQSKTAGTTTTITVDPTVEPVPGDMIIVSCARDDVASDTFPDTCSDALGNTYAVFRTASTNATNGTAADGTIAFKFICMVAVGWPSGSKTITWTHPSVAARAMVAEHFVSSLGRFYIDNPFSAASTTGVPSAALGTIPTGYMCHGTHAAEGTSVTGDADTSNGNWSTQETIATSGSTAATNQAVGTQYKITTGTAAQTYNPTSASTDATVIAVVLYEDALPSKWGTITDDFSTESANWDWSETEINATGGFLTGNVLSGYPSMSSSDWHDLTDSSVLIEGYKNSTSLGAATSRSCAMLIEDWPGWTSSSIRWYYGEGNDNITWEYHRLGVYAEGGTISTTDRWIRMRFDDSNDTYYWDSSADGISWTNRANKTVAQVGFRPNAAGITIYFGHYLGETEPHLFSLDNFNLPPVSNNLPIDDASIGVTGYGLSNALRIIDDALIAFQANNLINARRIPTATNVPFTAYNLTTSGRKLTLASLGFVAASLATAGLYGPQPGVTQPGGSTVINPGDAYQTKINTAGTNADLWWTAGTYDFSAVTELSPIDGQTWTFEFGAVIDGGGVSEVAIGGDADNVTFTNMRVTNFASPRDIGAVHCYDGLNWLFDHCEFDENAHCGLHITYDAEVRWSKFHHNGQAGLMCRGFEGPSTFTTGLWVHHNEIAFNNPNNEIIDVEGEDIPAGDWDAGGLKFFGTDGLLLEHNWAHDNVGPGLWLDIDNKNATIEENLCEDNANHGIFYEISFGDTLIDSNICRNNGFGTYGVGGGGANAPVNAAPAGIFISNSSGVICSNNTVTDNYTGIILINVDRSAENPLYDLADVQVLNNVISGSTSYSAGVMGEDIPLGSLVDIDFQGNTYPGVTGDSWHWGDPLDFAEWNALGFDISGATELQDAAFSLSANNLSTQRTADDAGISFGANDLQQLRQALLDEALVSLSAHGLSADDRTLAATAAVALAAGLLSSARAIGSADVAMGAYGLSRSAESTIGQAALALVAYGLSHGNVLSYADIAFIANNLAFNATPTLETANAAFSAFNVQAGITKPLAPWRGVGLSSFDYEDLVTLDISWWYDWGHLGQYMSPLNASLYVPMVWGDPVVTNQGGGSIATIGNGAEILLGFNEPDKVDQANMTVARALELWPELEATNAILGSPVVSADPGALDWLADFMAGVGSEDLRVDFICAHWYGDGTTDVADLLAYLDNLHELYGRPIWLTEFDVYDEDEATNAAFATAALTALQDVSYVERIAWFTNRDYPEEPGYENVGLIDGTGALTDTGTAYVAFDNAIEWDNGVSNLDDWAPSALSGYAKIETLIDDFEGSLIKEETFAYHDHADIDSGRLRIESRSDFAGFVSSLTYWDLVDSNIFLKITPASGPTHLMQVLLRDQRDQNYRIELFQSNTDFWIKGVNAGIEVALDSTTYDAVNHAWWRVRHDGTTIHVDTSANGATWNDSTLSILAADLIWIPNEVEVAFSVGFSGAESTPAYVYVDNLNTSVSTFDLETASPIGFSANPLGINLTLNESLIAVAANNLLVDMKALVGQPSIGFSANNLLASLVATIEQASIGFSSYGLGRQSNVAQVLFDFSAFNLSRSSTPEHAALSFGANNLSPLIVGRLQQALVEFSAYNLFNSESGDTPLTTAEIIIAAFDLVAEIAPETMAAFITLIAEPLIAEIEPSGSSAGLGAVAMPLSFRGASAGTAEFEFTTFNLTPSITPNVVANSIITSAFNLIAQGANLNLPKIIGRIVVNVRNDITRGNVRNRMTRGDVR